MSEVRDIARVIYEAKKKTAWGNWESQYRGKWPETDKELRTRQHNGDSGLEFAFAQASAVMKHFNVQEKE